jgi:ABC-2 type transport system ATP-binding protein
MTASVLIRATQVTKRYRGRVAVLDASICVGRGEAVAVVGENGAGKSTLLRICAGLVVPDRGEVTVAGTLGYCPQDPGLLELLTADEHSVLFGAGLGVNRSDAQLAGRTVLDRLGFRATEHGVVTRHLSGGARQKLNLALALLGDPQVLLLDEPYQGFDRGGYISFWDLVAQWRTEGRAVVIVTHVLPDPSIVDRVLELGVAS